MIYAVHVSDPSIKPLPFPSVEEAVEAIHETGGHVLNVAGNRVTYSDYPRKQNPAPVLNIPTLNLTLLTDRLS